MKNPLRLPLSLVLLVGCVLPAAAQNEGPAELLAAVDPLLDPVDVPSVITAPPSFAYGLLPSQLTVAGERVFFVADDRQHGPELWVSDGTVAGTRQVADLLPGAEGARPRIAGTVGERVVFWAQTAALGVELHASDGTAAGTVLLADTCAGECSGADLPEHWFQAEPAWGWTGVPFGGGLAVPARSAGGCSLWTTDGTPGSTALADPWGGTCGVVEGDGDRVWYGDATASHLRLFEGQGGRTVALPMCSSSFFWLREAAPHAGGLVVLGRCFGVADELHAWWLRPDQSPALVSPRATALGLLRNGDRLLLALEGAEGAPVPGGGWELFHLVGPGLGLSPAGRLLEGDDVVLLAVHGEAYERVLVEARLPQGGRLLAVPPNGIGEVIADAEIRTVTDWMPASVARVGSQIVFWSARTGGEEWTWELWTTGADPASTRRVTAFTTPASGLVGSDWRVLVPPELAVLPESLVLAADDGAGQQLWGLERGEASRWGCQPGPETLCLGGERFAVRVDWRDPRSGDTGAGIAVAVADGAAVPDSGYFWFFRPGNLELLVKVLDGTGVNGHHWVFHGPMTDVEYDLHVTDLATGFTHSYHRPAGSLCGGADTSAFLDLGPSSGEEAAAAPAPSEPVRAPLSPPPPPCDPRTSLCLGEEGRFRVEVTFRDHRNGSGEPQSARWVAETEDSGSFWFFRPDNREVLVKVIDGTAVNGWWWVFVGSMTDLAFEVSVFDTYTQVGGLWTYEHPQGSLCGTSDTTAPF